MIWKTSLVNAARLLEKPTRPGAKAEVKRKLFNNCEFLHVSTDKTTFWLAKCLCKNYSTFFRLENDLRSTLTEYEIAERIAVKFRFQSVVYMSVTSRGQVSRSISWYGYDFHKSASSLQFSLVAVYSLTAEFTAVGFSSITRPQNFSGRIFSTQSLSWRPPTDPEAWRPGYEIDLYGWEASQLLG